MSRRRDLSEQTRNNQVGQYKRTIEAREDAPKPAPTVRIGDRDPVTGRDNVIHPSGSQTTNGVRVFNASVPAGGFIEGLQGYGNDAIALNARNAKPVEFSVLEEEEKVATFWNLNADRVYEIVVRRDKATAKLLTQESDFPFPYSNFHRSEPGLARINRNEFYIPNFNTINRLNISAGTGSTAISGLTSTFSACSLPTGHTFFGIKEGSNTYILRINPDGSSDRSVAVSTLNLWSVAAVSPDIVYVVEDYNTVFRYDFATSSRTDIFTTTAMTPGSNVDGFEVREITYVFADPRSQACYAVGFIRDSQIPGLPDSYVASNLIVAGDVPAGEEAGFPTKVITGNFGPYTLPGDSGMLSIGGNRLEITRVLDDNTVYGYRVNGFLDWLEPITANFNIGDRHTRTTIWKITGDSVTTHFRFPGVDNRQTISGYRQFFNLPCRAGIFDPKTKSIFMVGFRSGVVENGRLLGNLEQPSDNLLVRISRGQFQAMAIAPSADTPQDFNISWEWFSQLEPT